MVMMSKKSPTKSNLPAAVVAVGAAVAVGRIVAQQLAREDEQKEAQLRKKPNMSAEAAHNVQRKAALAHGGAKDHMGSVVLVPDEDFELDATIFKGLSSQLSRMNQHAKLGLKQYWDEDAALQVERAYSQLPAAPRHDAAILNFMSEECDFACEHADGSFMDHLNFCHDYSALHYKAHSPRVLFLHSIMGVGTNVFPMTADKVPQLESLLTPFEFAHIESFPSIVRLLADGSLLHQLNENMKDLGRLQEVSFHRVLDNKRVTMDAENFWIHMNFQLIHLLDFLPVACWGVNWDEPMMQIFLDLYKFMNQAGRLEAHVVEPALDVSNQSTSGQPQRWVDSLIRVVPSSVKRSLATRSIRKFSAEVGHSLDFEIKFA